MDIISLSFFEISKPIGVMTFSGLTACEKALNDQKRIVRDRTDM
jgi:hypothetical protein